MLVGGIAPVETEDGEDMKKQGKVQMNKATGSEFPGEWLYVTTADIDVRRIVDALPTELDIELWEEAGVLEINLGEKQSIDMEHVKIHPKDELTRSFVEEHGCSEVYLVTFAPEIYGQAKEIMQKILAECGGLFCGDTEDFAPIMQNQHRVKQDR